MTPNAETPAAGSRPSSTGPVKESQSGPVAELGLVAAGLGLVIYLISFVADLGGSTAPALPLLLGGGLLAGTVALPTVNGRVLAPAAVLTTTGALLLLRTVVDDGGGALVAGALVLGLLEAGATVGATLMQAGVVRSRPPKAPKASAASAFAGYPGGPQFPGQQYPGQPLPGTYPAAPATEPYPGDQWTGEHAYGQNAQYGSQYGVPGYPPPPPYGAPGFDPTGYDPTGHAAEAPTVAVGAEPPDHEPASPPRGTRPVTEPVAGDLGSGYRSAVEPGTGSHRAVPDPAAAAFRPVDAATGTGTHRAVPDPGVASGTGPFRVGSRSAPPEGTGSHRAASGTGSYPADLAGTGGYRRGAADLRSDDDGEHTRALPTVPDEQR
jgi:hypothetical protein